MYYWCSFGGDEFYGAVIVDSGTVDDVPEIAFAAADDAGFCFDHDSAHLMVLELEEELADEYLQILEERKFYDAEWLKERNLVNIGREIDRN